jgi:hypothetical protein
MSASHHLRLAAVLAYALLAPAATQAAPNAASKPSVRISPACAGDVVSARIAVRTSSRTQLTVRLLQRRTPRSAFVRTGREKTFTNPAGRRTHSFSFDISTLDAFAYRLSVIDSNMPPRYRFRSSVMPAASCAPGRDVPEAPFALLLSFSVIATTSLLLVGRKALA